MKTSTIVTLVVIALLAIGGITIFSTYVSYNNKEVSLRAQSDAQIKVIEGYHDNCYNKDWEMTGQMHALNYLKWARGGDYIPTPWAK